MNTIDIRQQVKLAIDQSWDEFAREHPQLARAIDRQVLVERAVASLDQDGSYQLVMREALALGTLSAEAIGLIRSLVRKILALV